MTKAIFLLFTVMFAISALAANGKSVSYKSGDETVQATLYTPTGKGPFPGIIVIHEWWGLNDWVKEQASKLADQGYAALAVDLYRGKSRPHLRRRMKSCGACPKTVPSPICTRHLNCLNPNNKTGYRPEDAADAWQRTVNFLASKLKK